MLFFLSCIATLPAWVLGCPKTSAPIANEQRGAELLDFGDRLEKCRMLFFSENDAGVPTAQDDYHACMRDAGLED